MVVRGARGYGPATMRKPAERTAPFGARDVPAAEKAGLVRDVFGSVARRYDLMNDLMSGGVHRLWKAALIDRLRPHAGTHVLDVAGGTGDVAFRILGTAPTARVTVVDLSREMVAVGRDRAIDRGIDVDWLVGDAEALPLKDRTVDAYTIAFGLRNVTHIERALGEARRVLRPGGRFLCLEFSHVAVPMLGALYDRYSDAILPRLGQIVARDRDAYVYLVESIRRFPPQETLRAMVADAGLARADVQNLSGGIAAIHGAWRL